MAEPHASTLAIHLCIVQPLGVVEALRTLGPALALQARLTHIGDDAGG